MRTTSTDDVSGIGSGADDRAQDAYNLRAQRAVSNFDITHRFTFSATYDLPFGKGRSFFGQAPPVISALISDWQVNSITTWQSGLPFTVTVGSFDAVAQISNRRPNVVSDPRQNVPAGLSFNPAAFVAPPAGQLGNSGRNTLRGDRYYNTDISLIRQFPLRLLGDAGSLNFRAEFFNVFNHPNFNLPVSALSSNAFGRFVNNATAPRIVQFALKVTF